MIIIASPDEYRRLTAIHSDRAPRTAPEPARIGVQLTDGFMMEMEPEASVSALVFHHPDAAYFSAGEDALAEEGA